MDTEKGKVTIDLGTFQNQEQLRPPQMEALSALCDTFLSAVDTPAGTIDDDVAQFYRTSASMIGTPERVGELLSQRLQHPSTWLLRLVLWLLSTWIGTLAICGFLSLSRNFPFFRKFSEIPVNEREKILRNWSQSSIKRFRMMFNSFKSLILLVFFSQVDDKNKNHTWKAIGYPGPDPGHASHTCHDTPRGPLWKNVINLDNPDDIETVKRSGFAVSGTGKDSLVITADAVVVGSGAGGGVAAGILSTAGYKVLVVEQGRYFARDDLSLLEASAMDQMYLAGGLLPTNDTGFMVLAGATVGGGTAVNWSACIKTPPHVRNEWCEKYGLELFESELYGEAMEAVCSKMGVQSETAEEGFNSAVLRNGCLELGYPVSDIPRNAPADHYCGWCHLGCKTGGKKGTSETWLVDVVNSGNGLILQESTAVKIITKRVPKRRNVAAGVVLETAGRKRVVIESKVTVVSGGALSTPYLLKRSGLRNKNIGKHLHLHPVVMGWGHFPDADTCLQGKRSYEGGIMTAMSRVDTDAYGTIIQTPALHPGMFAASMPWVSAADIKSRMLKFPRTAHVFALVRDRGSGTVTVPTNIKYEIKKQDENKLKKGLEKVLRILAAAGAGEIGTHHWGGRGVDVGRVSSDEFERFVREESGRGLGGLSGQLFSAHQMGSCRMGCGPKESVVGPTGETWEVEGLFVADASVLPTAVGVNPMVTVQAVALCTALGIVQFLKRKKCSGVY